MSGGWVGSWPTRILLVIAVALLSIGSVAAMPTPVPAGQGNVSYAYDGTNAEPGAAAVQRTVHLPDQRVVGNRPASASLAGVTTSALNSRAPPRASTAIDWPQTRQEHFLRSWR